MGSISGLKSNLLLIRPVYLHHIGSKPEENDLLLMKLLLIRIIDKEHNKQVSWHYCGGLDNSPLVITFKNLYRSFGPSQKMVNKFLVHLPGIR